MKETYPGNSSVASTRAENCLATTLVWREADETTRRATAFIMVDDSLLLVLANGRYAIRQRMYKKPNTQHLTLFWVRRGEGPVEFPTSMSWFQIPFRKAVCARAELRQTPQSDMMISPISCPSCTVGQWFQRSIPVHYLLLSYRPRILGIHPAPNNILLLIW